ncbi:cytoplasmic protein, partial [Bacillus thuringiensis]|uniref:cytoplasmic protein n=1 Tax=Bacillus thuringiensis TaxID=1428 RepID=UPI00284E07C6
SNTVLIRASWFISSIPLDDWRTTCFPCLQKLDDWFFTFGEKYVVFEYGDICHRMGEHYFNTLLPRIPYSSRFMALRNVKGV